MTESAAATGRPAAHKVRGVRPSQLESHRQTGASSHPEAQLPAVFCRGRCCRLRLRRHRAQEARIRCCLPPRPPQTGDCGGKTRRLAATSSLAERNGKDDVVRDSKSVSCRVLPGPVVLGPGLPPEVSWRCPGRRQAQRRAARHHHPLPNLSKLALHNLVVVPFNIVLGRGTTRGPRGRPLDPPGSLPGSSLEPQWEGV